ncbi:MAG: hypothetical protein ACXABG_04575 [Promethearchaeota archaeon]|jgi:hypothetical protein
MGETEWKHAGWVSGIGKWAWIVLLVNCILGIVVTAGTLATAFALLGPFALIGSGVSFWNIIASVIGIIFALFIIRPKFSKPCGEKDWEALYSWTLKLGGSNVPWMFIWGILLFVFGWYGWGGLFVLLPAIMLIWVGPRKYEWK